jgi:uncharacterized protein YndB with AHSA1/START domain
MIRVEHSVTIDRPPSEVFTYMCDADKLPEWQSTALEARWETTGPIAVGSRAVEVRKFLGRRMESRMEVTAFEQDRELSFRVLDGPVQFQVIQKLEAVDGGTRIDVVLEGEPGGFFKLAEPLVARAAKRQLEGDSATMKDILETRG